MPNTSQTYSAYLREMRSYKHHPLDRFTWESWKQGVPHYRIYGPWDKFEDIRPYLHKLNTEVFDGLTTSHHTLRDLKIQHGTDYIDDMLDEWFQRYAAQ